MEQKNPLIPILFSLFAILLLILGLALFMFRQQYLKHEIAHKVSSTSQIARPQIIKNQFLILIDPDHVKNLEQILQPLNLKILYPILDWILVSSSTDSPAKYIYTDNIAAEEDRSILNSLLHHPHILDAHHNSVLHTFVLPENHKFNSSWHFNLQSSRNPAGLNMPLAWEITQGAKNITIGVIDHFFDQKTFTFFERFPNCKDRITPFVPTHKNLENKLISEIIHGEIMLLSLGACAQSSSNPPGMDWHAKLLAVEREDMGHAQSFIATLAAAGIDICTESIISCLPDKKVTLPKIPADILLLPFGSSSPDLLQFSSNMIERLHQENKIIISAAGNNNSEARNFFPGGSPGIINTGSITKQALRAPFSNWGPAVDIFAPGENLNFVYPSGIKNISGTSLSASFVAGTVSLMKAVYPNLSPKKAKYFLTRPAKIISCDNYCPDYFLKKNTSHCKETCCDATNNCKKLILNPNNSIRMAQNKKIDQPLVSLSKYYILFSAKKDQEKQVVLKNISNNQVNIISQSSDKNMILSPSNFTLNPHKKQVISISFKKDFFQRRTLKILFNTNNNTNFNDQEFLFLEYIP